MLLNKFDMQFLFLVISLFIIFTVKSFRLPCRLPLSPRLHVHAHAEVPYVPYFPNKLTKEYQWLDIYNALGRERKLFVSRFIDDDAANTLIASLIWLQGKNEIEPVTLYFNVPGGRSKPSLAVFDVMNRLSCPLVTINVGLSVGPGALLCAAGTKGHRYAMPNARFVIARCGLEEGVKGVASDVALEVSEVIISVCFLASMSNFSFFIPLSNLMDRFKRIMIK
jgi:ATP-dependent Clp endopeptidase proteolytic subunit ClpP